MKRTVNTLLFTVALAIGASTLGATENGAATLKQLTRQTKALESTVERQQDHQILAAQYRRLALLQREEANKMDQRTRWYEQFPIYSSEKYKRATIDSSRYFARKYRADADRSDNLALRHERLAS